MLCVQDICQLSTFSHARAYVPLETCAGRRVCNLGVLDYEALTEAWESFAPTDVIITTLGFSNNDSAKVRSALLQLAHQGVASIFVKDVFGWRPDEELCEEFSRLGVGLFIYEQTPLEDMIFELKVALDQEKHSDRARALTSELIHEHNPQRCISIWHELTHSKNPDAFALCIQTASGGLATQALIQTITRECDAALIESTCVTHDDVILVWCACKADESKDRTGTTLSESLQPEKTLPVSSLSPSTPPTLSTSDICSEFAMRLARLDGVRFVCVSELFSPKNVSLAGVEVLWLYEHALAQHDLEQHALGGATRLMDASTSEHTDAHPYSCSLVYNARETSYLYLKHALTHTAFGQYLAQRELARLSTYDTQHGLDLVDCLHAYVQCGGTSDTCAQILHQHPNSIRNRLKKIRELLFLGAISDKEFFAYMSFIAFSNASHSPVLGLW